MKNVQTMNKPNWSMMTILSLIAALILCNTAEAQSPPCNTAAPKTYVLTETSSGEIYIPNASTRPWKGGDTLKIPAKNYSLIEISNFSGDACKPIIIINSGGQVVVTTWRMRNDSRYFRITGTGKPGVEYGFKINGGMMAISLAHHFEVDHVEATGGSLGFYFKTTPVTSDPRTIYTAGSSNNYVMSDIYIHHNYLHDIAGEAMYIGHTGPSGGQEGTGLIPLRLDNVEIAYNTITNVDWDGIQLSNARNNAKIHHNTIWNFGRINKGSQQSGIIMGGNTSGEIYNNKISKGSGNGIQVFGYGNIKLYNNEIDSSGWDNTSNGQESVYMTDAPTGPESNPKQQVQFYNNIVRNPKPKGAIRIGSYSANSLPSSITNNQYCIPGAASNWITFYVVANTPGSVLSNNVLSCGGVIPPPANLLPVANAGADKVITLPLATVSLNGSGTDPDGSIVSYQWTKISGPSTGILNNPTAAIAGLISLIQGVYKYELKVTDNNGGTGRDTVQVTVNPLLAIPTPPAPPPAGGKAVRVNIHGGTSFSDAKWNNWNTSSSLNSGVLKYEDGSSSTIKAVLGSQAMIADNAANYATASTTPPSAVLRYNSASTSNRDITISGLNKSIDYIIEFYGSRKSTGNKTIFKTGNRADTINTDNNVNDVARFLSIRSDNSGNIKFTMSRIGTWNYIAGFSVIEEGTDEGSSAQMNVNAGPDMSVSLPLSSVELHGVANVSGATVSSYEWTKVSGPAATLQNPNSADATVSALTSGTYVFQLQVVNSLGTTATDVVQIVVAPENIPAPTGGRAVKVNISNGSVNYTAGGWNNWNTAGTLSTPVFKYEDGSSSTIKATLDAQAMTIDNGAGYASSSSSVPGDILRFNSASTSNRNITITGLSAGATYSLEFYGSRKSTGNKTVVISGNSRDTINTDNNSVDFAVLSLTADQSGKIEVTISRIGTWNYLAGFIIRDGDAVRGMDAFASQAVSVPENIGPALKVFPNPFTTSFQVELDENVKGQYTISVIDVSGKILLTRQGLKTEKVKTETVNTSSLSHGHYYVQIVSDAGRSVTQAKKIAASQY